MAELDRAAIAVRLAEARTKAGLTQAELADILEMHPRSVQNYENPKLARVPFDFLGQWAEATGVTREWLLHGDDVVATSPDRIAAIEEELRLVREELVAVRETRVLVERVLGLVESLQADARARADSA